MGICFMRSESLKDSVKKVEPPRGYCSPRIPFLIAAAAVAVACTSAHPDAGPGIGFEIYEAGINFLDKHPKIGESRLGKAARNKLVDLAIGSAFSHIRIQPSSELFERTFNEPRITVVVKGNDSASSMVDTDYFNSILQAVPKSYSMAFDFPDPEDPYRNKEI